MTQHRVSGVLYEIEISKDRKTVTVWAGGNFDESPVEHFGATPEDTEEEITNQVKEWLTDTWGSIPESWRKNQ